LVVYDKKRPTLPVYNYDNITLYLFNIMNECWNHEINSRPSIKDIWFSMHSKLNEIKYFFFLKKVIWIILILFLSSQKKIFQIMKIFGI
jgi:hypothetical protein